MQLRHASLIALLLGMAFAGCLDDGTGDPDPTTGRTHQTLPAGLELSWAPGAISSIHNPAPDDGRTGVSVQLPFGWLAVTGDDQHPRHLEAIPHQAVVLQPGETHWFLAPPRTGTSTFTVGTQQAVLQAPHTHQQVISGENVWDLSAHQEANYPHRQVNLPGGNYWTAIEYFADHFEELGMEVEVDPYDTESLTMDGTLCTPDPDVPTDTREPCPGSAANVVATLPGTDPDAPTIFVAGGHFDMVATTTHAAFDDTSGTVATLELARAMSRFEWRHTLKFGLWGGEEDGIVGSQFWVQSHPEARSTITTYWNLDVVGMSWPAPLPKPDPIVIAAGPDAPDPGGEPGDATGPIAEPMLELAQELQATWFGHPDEHDGERMWYYEGVASGQGAVTGTTGDVSGGRAGGYAGVNAVSDHTPFVAAGIPAFFAFNGDALAGDNPVELHTEKDTLENMTRYAYFGGERTQEIMVEEEDAQAPYEWDPEEYQAAKQTLAESWEVLMWFPFYVAAVQDTGYWTTPGPAGQEPPAT